MTGLQTAAAAGMLVGAGVVLGVRALRPAPPSLPAALAQLSAAPTAAPMAGVPVGYVRARWDWLPTPVGQLLDRHLGVCDADLRMVGSTRAQLLARKLTLAATGLLAPSLLGLGCLLLGLPVPVFFPAAMSLGLAAVGWFLPSQETRERAATARLAFRSNLESFLTLVAGERRARGSVEQALEEASEVSGSMPFTLMRRAIRRAALAGRKPWSDLRDLGAELEVPELRNLADIAAVAADGASVYATLLATARTLRHAELSDRRAEANQVSERMSRPLSLLVAGLTLFVLVPFVLRMLGTS